MYSVYILQDNLGHLYKGMTGNSLEERLKQHLGGNTKTTRRMEGLKLIYSEVYQTAGEARTREKYFKSAAGRRWLKVHLPR